MRLQDLGDLPDLNAQVHDAWLDLDRTVYDKDEAVVRIPMERRPSEGCLGILGRKISGISSSAGRESQESVLTIRNALECTIHDSEHIGFYDISRVDFDSVRQVVTVRTNIPLVLEVKVSALDLQLERLRK